MTIPTPLASQNLLAVPPFLSALLLSAFPGARRRSWQVSRYWQALVGTVTSGDALRASVDGMPAAVAADGLT